VGAITASGNQAANLVRYKGSVVARVLPSAMLVECLMEIVDGSDHRLIRLAGRLAEAQVPELLLVCSNKSLALQLHLGDLISLDAVGLNALHELRRGGAQLLEVPAYIQLKLDILSAKTVSRHRR
jgi:hypothetical protein